MSWPGPTPCTSSDDALPPNDALELLRRCLTLSTAPWAAQFQAHPSWSASTSSSVAFQDAIGWLGLELISKQRHMRLCSILARQEENEAALAASDASHRLSGLRAYQGRKRSRDNVPPIISLASIDEATELRATQLRPRALRATGASSPSLMGFVEWVQHVERNRDTDAVMEFLGLASSAQLLRCVYAVGVVGMWTVHGASVELLNLASLLRVLTCGTHDNTPNPAHVVCWTAAFTQTLYQPPSPPLEGRGVVGRAQVTVDTAGIHIEGVVQLLFPSDATSTFVNVFVAPMLASLAVTTTGLPYRGGGQSSSRVSAGSGTKLRELLAACCNDLAPFVSRGTFGGLDVPRGAKYYPAARKLQLLWMDRYKTLFVAAASRHDDGEDSDGGDSSSSNSSLA
ncbi:Hypothetical protein, putative [Bodo saltans]|uniref:Uncharacterized protein n=1 Tax=Bodo saltans TaxID=75058 RepID=A0A0S4ILL6_BODSA|nr:Hypothetical protein, putative [Bodo saltans]|eukprot:CUE69971.1 Hypothetical protein, putative [Bodo saltans]